MNIFEELANEFEETMQGYSKIESKEDRHRAMDNLMCETLEKFGCQAGVDIFRSTSKWYA